MKISFHRVFRKNYRKLERKEQLWFNKRLTLFKLNPFHPLLNNHGLDGEWKGCRSINVAGDLRAIFRERDDGGIEFLALGTHPELYGM